MTTTPDDTVEPGPPHIVHVQQNTEPGDVDDYVIEGGMQLSVESGDDRELFITKTSDDSTYEMVALYAQGTWLRAWVEEAED